MSQLICCTETNEFKVKNVDEVKSVFEELGFTAYNNKVLNTVVAYSDDDMCFNEDMEVILSKKPIEKNGEKTNFVGVCSDCMGVSITDILLDYQLTTDDVVIQSICEYLQDQLITGCGITITSAGFESRLGGNNNPFCEITIITKNTVEYISPCFLMEEKAKELGVEI